MTKSDQQMRDVERSLAQLSGDKVQATKIRKGLEKKIQQAAVTKLPAIAQSLVKSGRAGWANDPDTPGGAVLVERGTGCVLLDPKGNVFQRASKVNHPPTSAINEMAFIQHLKDAGNELYVPYMYKDLNDNVTVGIGTHLENAQQAKNLPFVDRGTNQPVHDNHKINAYNKVRNSPISGAAGHLVFKPLTNIVISEADAVNQASKDLQAFIGELKMQRFYRDFDTFPVTAKMGLLDLIYTLGLPELLNQFKKFNPAVRSRDWKFAASESSRKKIAPSRNQIVQQWFEQAAKQEPIFVSVLCTKRIDLVFR